MSFVIDNLVTRCRAPRSHRAVRETVDLVARARLADALGGLLGASLWGQPAVVRVRRLKVTLKLSATALTEEAIIEAWSRALAQSLFASLACGGDVSGEVMRADSMSDFLGAFLRDLRAGHAAGQWQYAGFEPLLRVPFAQAVMTLLLEHPGEIAGTLACLEQASELAALLDQLDDFALERLFAAIARREGVTAAPGLSAEDLAWTARRAFEMLSSHAVALESRRLALRIFVTSAATERRMPRAIHHALLALTQILRQPDRFGSRGALAGDASRDLAPMFTERLPASVEAVLRDLAQAPGRRFADQLKDALSGPRLQLLERAAGAMQAEVAPAWIESASAGLMLLVRALLRTGLHRLEPGIAPDPWQAGRLRQSFIAGIGAAVLGTTLGDEEGLDPVVALFAGVQGAADSKGMRQMLESMDPVVRRAWLSSCLPRGANDDLDWPAAFDLLAARLISEFASLVRGFRDAPRASIVRQFVRTRGRIEVTEGVVRVVLDAHPLHVALHVSGVDSALESIDWMGGRDIEFRLAGL